MTNRRVVLRSRPAHVPEPSNFEIVACPVPEPGEREMLVRNLYFSMEPAIRARLDDRVTYMPPIGLGEPIQSPTVGRVVTSNHPGYDESDLLYGFNDWQDYVVVSEDTLLLDRVTPEEGMPPSHYIGALGGSGTTAYVGLHDVGGIQPGETVVVSAAAGAVGSVAGQVARLRGCRVVGLVGSAEKAAVDAMLLNMKIYGRVVACGMMAGYNQQDRPPGVFNLWEIVARQLRMQGFLLPTYAASIPKALEELHNWVRSGDLVVLENVNHGLHRAPDAFCHLMAGGTIGKTLLALDAEGAMPSVATLEQQIS